MRGYEYQSISPRDSTGQLVGGRSLLEMSAEVRYRASDTLGYVAFLDGGACQATGQRALVLDGPTVTARRTAAVSLLAAQRLAPGSDGPLLIVGAGAQAQAHLEAFDTREIAMAIPVAAQDTCSRHWPQPPV